MMVNRMLVLAHLLSVLVFFGNIVAAFLLHARARRTREPAVLAQLFGAINSGDRWVTPPSVIAILASGIALAVLEGLSITGTGWIFWSLSVFGLSGVVLVLRLLPLQRRLEFTAAASAEGQPFDRDSYRRDERAWSLWSAIAASAALCAVVLMVLRPSIPGL